jgi:lysophospholipase L1-like esterase
MKKLLPIILFFFFASICRAEITFDGVAVDGVTAGTSDTPIIMAVGDSITFGQYSTDGTGWRRGLYSALNVAHTFVGPQYPAALVNDSYDRNAGYTGKTAEWMNRGWNGIDWHLDGWMPVSNTNHQIVQILMGTNDLNADLTNPTAAAISGYLISMVNKIIAHNPLIDIYVGLLTKRNDTFDDEVTTLNAQITSDVQGHANYNNNLFLVDLNTGFNAGTMLNDNVHPNDTGFTWMAQQWATAINGN